MRSTKLLGSFGLRTGFAARSVLRGYVILVFAFLLLPIAIIVPMSFSDQLYLSFPPPGWTLHWYEAVREQPRWLTAAINSLYIGVPATLLAVTFGTLAALGRSLPLSGLRIRVTP